MFYLSIGIANFVAQKQLRVLATGTDGPDKDYPGVPTMDSLGYSGFQEGARVVADTPEHFRQFLIDDKTRWATVIKKDNVKGE